jgi:hypothetical protein
VRRCSTPEEQEIIEEKRAALVAMFAHLRDLQSIAGIVENSLNAKPVLDNETEYDEYDESTNQTTPVLSPIEHKVIIIPSNGNVKTDISDLEIKFRTRQANTELNQLRDLIADISFQFSHVIRGQIRKNIRTRSQKRIKLIHNQVTLHARIYARCRNHLIALDCGETILRQYRVLTKEDLKSSTEILDPNRPGSTRLKLSWIWHSSRWLLMSDNAFPGAVTESVCPGTTESDAAADAGPAPFTDAATLCECDFFLHTFFFNFLNLKYLVKRVHFLRARALKNRWEEEHILLNYEMQWTVRFFKNKAEKWKVASHYPDITRGAKAYALRQEFRWKQMAINSDSIFKNTSSDYISPFT